jgi:hemerythrin-like metal-binding protein
MMNFIEWTEEMSVGSGVLDGHHRMIIDCLNDLHPLIGCAGKEQEVRRVLAKLEDFVLVHFSEEELCMRRAGYPDWRAHREQHDGMFDIVLQMKSDVEHGRTPDAKQLFDMIYDWLLRHIMGEDKKYVEYLRNPRPMASDLWTRANGRPY